MSQPEIIPEFSFGQGRNQINLKGKEAIKQGGWSIRFLLVARALAILLPPISAAIALVIWRLG
jgi:hypothetical protein